MMAQYFFHVRQDRTLFEDRWGCELPDIAAAWKFALSQVRTMIDEDQLSGPIDQQWIEICDRSGKAVVTLPFARVAHLN